MALITYSCLTYQQWRAALESNRITKVSADASTAAAEAAKQSLDVARKTQDANTRALELDQWPYVVQTEVRFSEPPVPGVPIHANVFFRNSGKSPAINLRSYRGVIVIDFEDKGMGAKIDRVFHRLRKQLNTQGQQMLPPGGSIFITTREDLSLSAEDITALHCKRKAIVLISGVTYKDLFERSHETETCHLFGDDFRMFHFCETHNGMR